MIVDGHIIAHDIYRRIQACTATRTQPLRMAAVTCAPTFATRSYLSLKSRKAEEMGIGVSIHECSADASTDEVIAAITAVLPQSDGVVVQLPFPPHIDVDQVLAQIPPTHDVDALNPVRASLVLAPVVGACKEILERHAVSLVGTTVLVVGRGRLVGKPAAQWFAQQGAQVTVVDKRDASVPTSRDAQIVVLGAGSPGILTPDMITEGVVILDAGTSEVGGELRGDADPACAEKASLMTPVPGGIGPITVAMLLSNLVTLADR